MKTALVLVANGSSEVEAVISIDVLRRAEVSVTVAAVGLPAGTDGSAPRAPFVLTCCRRVGLVAETRVEDLLHPSATEFKSFDAVVVPGGLDGALKMAEDEHVKRLLYLAWKAGVTVAAICAGPTVLKAAGVGLGGELTSYPAVRDQLDGAYKYLEKRVVVSKPSGGAGTVVTSRGPCTSFEFAIAIVKHLCGADKAAEVWKALIPWTDIENVVA